MPVITDKPISTSREDVGATLQRIYRLVGDSQIEAAFMDKNGAKQVVTRDYLEAMVEEYAQSTQNSSFFNKFLQIDTKLEKALREYAADIKMLLAGATSVVAAQTQVQQPIQPQQQPMENPLQQGMMNPVPEQV